MNWNEIQYKEKEWKWISYYAYAESTNVYVKWQFVGVKSMGGLRQHSSDLIFNRATVIRKGRDKVRQM